MEIQIISDYGLKQYNSIGHGETRRGSPWKSSLWANVNKNSLIFVIYCTLDKIVKFLTLKAKSIWLNWLSII